MKTRVRLAVKATAKGIVNPDFTVDCELEEGDSIDQVGLALEGAGKQFKESVVAMGYKNLEPPKEDTK